MNEPNPSKPIVHSVSPTRLAAYMFVAFTLIAIGVLVAGPVRGFVTGLTSSKDDSRSNDESSDGVTLYQSGMHPWIITTEPGNCPICGMKLEPIDPAKLTGEVTIDPVVVQNLGVRTTEVTEGPVTRTLRTVGTVTVAEPQLRDVNLRVSGWIETLNVDFVGAEVEVGQELFTIYSPELYAAQEEFLLSMRRGGDAELLASARDRLLNYGLTDAQVDELAASGRAARVVSILSEHHGVVLDKHANEGMRVDPGMRVFRIGDLSRVWVQVAVYEDQLPFVEIGQPASMSLPSASGQRYVGEVLFIDPTIDPTTRSVDLRLAFDNADGVLKPGMYVDVALEQTLAEPGVLAPREAVIDTGQRKIAFVSLGQGRFEPRYVQIGVRADGNTVQVIDGLAAGERVVVSGQFLLDSEASVRESLSRMVRGDAAADQAPVVPMAPAPMDERAIVTVATQAALDRAASSYLATYDALATDDLAAATSQLTSLRESLETIADEDEPSIAEPAAQARAALPDADDPIDDFREAFARVSAGLIELFEASPPSAVVAETLYVVHCPMVDKDWLQLDTTIRNPYATYMLSCGELQRAVSSVAPRTEGETHDH